MTQSHLQTLAYVSTASHEPSESDLLGLAYGAQRFNESAGVTGLLIFDRGEFLQVIEGPESAIAEVFERIAKDSLHHDIRVFVSEPIETRFYPDWAMLNSVEHSAASLKVILQFALDNRTAATTLGQIEAAHRILSRIV